MGPLRVSLGCFGVKVQVFEVMRVFCHRFYYLLPFLSRPEWCFSPIFPKSCFCWTRMSQMRRRKKMRRDELKPVSLDPTEPQPQPNPNPTLVHQATTRAFDASSCQCHAPFGGWLKAGDRRAGGDVFLNESRVPEM